MALRAVGAESLADASAIAYLVAATATFGIRRAPFAEALRTANVKRRSF
jgi:hypothetical protein